MEELLIYILKSSGLIVSFFLAYHFLLRKETFFNNNRWFLLSGLFISATLPLYFIKKVILVEKPKLSVEDILVMANHSNVAKSYTEITPQIESISWLQIAFIGYLLITAILFIKVVLDLISLFKLLNKNKIEKQNGLLYIDLQNDIAPFSFFNFIVFNSSLYSLKELESILSHEKIHSQQRHSFDVLFARLFTIIFWFNPFIWLYKKAIIQNLEYIADSQAIQLIEDKKCYQMALLKVVSHQNCLPITNNFYQSLIKKRIVMLNKNQSHKRNIWKYTVIIPALIAFIFLFQVKVVAQDKTSLPINNVVEAVPVGWVTNKNATDQEMKEDIKSLKEIYNIDYKFSNVKRNDEGEIIAIKISFNDNKGSKGEIKYDSDKPIKPIYFGIKKDKVGFFDYYAEFDNITPNEIKTVQKIINNDTVVWVNGKIDEKYIAVTSKQTESINESAPENSLIFIDSKKSTKKELDELNTDEIETMYVDKENNNSTIRIITKKGLKKIDDTTEIILNDKVISKNEMDKIDNSTIETVSVTNNNGKKKIIKIVSKRNLTNDDSKSNIEQSKLDTEQAKKDAEQAKLDIEQAKKDAEQAKLDAEQARKDALQARRDALQARKDAIQARNDALKAAKSK